jgi:hypothetical protein
VIPSYFLTLLWHNNNLFVRLITLAGVIAIASYTILFFKMLRYQNLLLFHKFSLSKALLNLAFVSFVIKSLLQAGTLYPALAHAVFGLRPVIIGFLHLVFLGLVSFYILSIYIETSVFNVKMRLTKAAFIIFITAVIVQETILMVQGIGLLLGMAVMVCEHIFGIWCFHVISGKN